MICEDCGKLEEENMGEGEIIKVDDIEVGDVFKVKEDGTVIRYGNLNELNQGEDFKTVGFLPYITEKGKEKLGV